MEKWGPPTETKSSIITQMSVIIWASCEWMQSESNESSMSKATREWMQSEFNESSMSKATSKWMQ